MNRISRKSQQWIASNGTMCLSARLTGVRGSAFGANSFRRRHVARGARGAVIDGFIRDARQILAMGFPVFTTGLSPVDSNGRGDVVAYNVPIECGGVTVNPGDIVFGDADGVVIIPQAGGNNSD